MFNSNLFTRSRPGACKKIKTLQKLLINHYNVQNISLVTKEENFIIINKL